MKVLIAIDSSPSSQRVLQTVLSRPRPSSTAFCILHVVDLQTFARLPVLIEEASREGAGVLHDAVKKLCLAAGTKHSASCYWATYEAKSPLTPKIGART